MVKISPSLTEMEGRCAGSAVTVNDNIAMMNGNFMKIQIL
jgi:hypothetical protein